MYGNVINRVMEHSTSPPPTVGMGATIYLWSDRLPATVTAVSASGKRLTLTEDDVTEWKDYYGTAFKANPNGRIWTAYLNHKGVWRILRSGDGVTLGTRAAYRDPGF